MSENPWVDLPQGFPRVLEDDLQIINDFNEQYENYQNYIFQTHLLPEPFFGDKDAPIYLLTLNPGYAGENDDLLHNREDFIEAVTYTQQHKNQNYPFYYFDPRFEESPGAKWWRQRCASLINDLGDNGLQKVARGLFCVELFPYHSKEFKKIPKKISSDPLFSRQYSIDLVYQAIEAGKYIIIMRSYKGWCKAVPKLKEYDKCHCLIYPRSIYLKENHLEDGIYDNIKMALNDNSSSSLK